MFLRFQFNARFTFSVTVCEFNTRERTKSCFGITVAVKSTSGLCYVDIAASRDSYWVLFLHLRSRKMPIRDVNVRKSGTVMS